MKPIDIGPGVAPDVTFVNGLVYVAYGTQDPMALVLDTRTLAGLLVGRQTLPNGFDQSFPRFSGPWLVYRQDEAHGFAATAYNVLTGKGWPYGPAGGTFSLTVNASLGLMAYEWRTGQEPWRISFGGLADGARIETALEGAPDGLDSIVSYSEVTLRAITRGTVPGIWYPVQAGYLTVGELRDEPTRPNGGIGVQLAGDVLRVALAAENTPDPRCATDGVTYAIVCWNPVRLLLGTAAELRALPPVKPLFTDKQPGPIAQEKTMLSVKEIRAIRNELTRFYMESDGLNRRARGIPEPIVYHDRGIEEWDAVALAHGVEEAKRQIRTFPEYKEQHKNENPQ